MERHCYDLQEDEVSVALVAVRALQQVFTRFLSTGDMFIAHMPTKEEGNDTEVMSQEKMAVSKNNYFLLLFNPLTALIQMVSLHWGNVYCSHAY